MPMNPKRNYKNVPNDGFPHLYKIKNPTQGFVILSKHNVQSDVQANLNIPHHYF